MLQRAQATLSQVQEALQRSGEGLRPADRRVVDALAWLEIVGLSPARETAIACQAGYRVRSAGWVTRRRKLIRRGLIVAVDGAALFALTQDGRDHASPLDPPCSADALHALVLAPLAVPERRIVRALLCAHPRALDLNELASGCRYDAEDDAFRTARERLRQLGLITRSPSGQMRASDVLLRHGPPGAVARHTDGERPRTHRLRPQLLHGGLRFAPSAGVTA